MTAASDRNQSGVSGDAVSQLPRVGARAVWVDMPQSFSTLACNGGAWVGVWWLA